MDFVRDKATDFLDANKTKEALDDLISIYGDMAAKDLELRATTVYVERNLRAKVESPTKKKVCHLVGQIKPKFSEQEIEDVVDELSGRNHIQLAV